MIDSLSQHYTCYAFDMLGHGESDKPARHFNIPDYATALDDACQLLNIHRGHYVGNSVGSLPGHGNGGPVSRNGWTSWPLVGCPLWNPWGGNQRVADTARGLRGKW